MYCQTQLDLWSDARVAEEARLESVYTPKGYREFESRSLRKKNESRKQNSPRFFVIQNYETIEVANEIGIIDTPPSFIKFMNHVRTRKNKYQGKNQCWT